MKDAFELKVKSRTDVGKGASRRLRHQGRVPGIVYGSHKEPEMITLEHDDLAHHLDNEAFFSHIIKLSVDGKTQQVVVKDLQRHPAKPFIQHIDFMRVSAKDAIRMLVPIHFLNEETSVGVKAGGVVMHSHNELEVQCLPADLPESIEIDMAGLGIGDSVMLSELTPPKGVEFIALMGEDSEDVAVASIIHPTVESESEEEATEGESGGESSGAAGDEE